MVTLSQSTIYTLGQLNDLLEKTHEDQYQEALVILSNNSVGKHVRHIIECYQSLLSGVSSTVIDYENRARNIALETSPYLAIQELININDAVQFLKEDKSVYLQVNQSHESEGDLLVKSTLAREIVYCLEHAIHHMAIIAIAVKASFPEIAIHPHFGCAYATIKHLERKDMFANK